MAEEQITLTQMHNGAVERLIDPKKIRAIALKNWMVLKSDKVRMIPLLMFPIIMIIIFGYATGSIPKHIAAGIVDYDHSGFSYSVQQQLSALEIFSIKKAVGTEDEGKRLMDSGEIKVLFILPEGFGEKVAKGEPQQIQIMVDESDSSVASISKSTTQAFAQQLSAQLTENRLDALSAKADSARKDLHAANSLASASASPASTLASQDAVAAYWNDARYTYARSILGMTATVNGLKNSLGYLVDQNEVADSFTPASMTTATLGLLATGDQQQSVLQQIGSYAGIQLAQSKMMQDSGNIYSNYVALASQSAAQQKSAQITVSLINSADSKLAAVSSGAAQATSPVGVQILEPYGYGRKAIDFLLPAILATIIFQGATMGLGRAIAGERKDGSLTRVFLTPTSNVTIILGTQLFYLALETVRSSFIIFIAMLLFGVSITGNVTDIIILIAIYAFGCTGVGMVLSVRTKTQEQYMAVGMLISLPVMFLSGVFFPVQTMPPILQSVAQFLPVTYAADALRGVMVKGFPLYLVLPDILALVIFGTVTLTLSLLLFKRELV